jgi:stearoyl-CoA desaturase (delta-9 desaturase)
MNSQITVTNAPGWLLRWFDNHAEDAKADAVDPDRIDWARCVPFIALHVACLGVFWTGWSVTSISVALGLYVMRMFVITGFYHRYFSHRSFKTSRWLQGLMAFVGCTSVQRDPIWWASHHAHHHANSDDTEDPHSPRQKGFWKSHVGWFLTVEGFQTRWQYAKDWQRFPELRFLNRFDVVPPILLALGLFTGGAMLERWAPNFETNGWQLLVWGFFVSTIALYHGTFTVNSMAHGFGSRRYATKDDSRNNFWIALLTLGEGWHNNHHHYPGASRQGFYWWEIDPTYYGLLVLEKLGLIWDIRTVPVEVRERNLVGVAR